MYEAAPITEATASIAFETAPSEADLRRLQRGIIKKYPKSEDVYEHSFRLGTTEQFSKLIGFRFTNFDGSIILIQQEKQFNTSIFAPYPGWDKFWSICLDNFAHARKIYGMRKVERIALRFKNRIDVPDEGALPEDYCKILIKTPDDIAICGFDLQSVFKMNGIKTSVNFSKVHSPLIRHTSFLIDLDTHIEGSYPFTLQEIERHFSDLRKQKNNIFEALITDKARSLFRRG